MRVLREALRALLTGVDIPPSYPWGVYLTEGGGPYDEPPRGKGIHVRRLGELEAEIMDRLWAWQRPATVREIVDDINRGRRVAYTTVMTVADILHRKGWLRREKAGRAWLYEPVRSREEYTAGLMRDALGDSQDRPAALLRFVEVISDEDMAALDAALRAARGGTAEGSAAGGGA